MAASELTAQMDALLERYAIGLHTEWRARGRQPPPPAATNCISGDGGKWLLAVGTSPLRLFTVGLAARLVGEEAMASASKSFNSTCMPSFRWLHHGSCSSHSSRCDHRECDIPPCILDLILPAGGRLTFIWAVATTRAPLPKLSEMALRTTLRDALPRTPDVLLIEQGAWQWGMPVNARAELAAAFLDVVRASIKPSPSDGKQAQCVWAGLPWGKQEDSHKWFQSPPTLDDNVSIAAFAARMRPLVAARGCAYLDLSRPCVARASMSFAHQRGNGLSRAVCKNPWWAWHANASDTRSEHLEGSAVYKKLAKEREARCCKEDHCFIRGRYCKMHPYGGPDSTGCFYGGGCVKFHSYGAALDEAVAALLSALCARHAWPRQTHDDMTRWHRHEGLHQSLMDGGLRWNRLCFWDLHRSRSCNGPKGCVAAARPA